MFNNLIMLPNYVYIFLRGFYLLNRKKKIEIRIMNNDYFD